MVSESFFVSAQDTILFNSGDEILVKVTEVNDTEIKYQLWVNLSGPVYTKKVSEIFMIKYNGGYREIYSDRRTQNLEKTSFGEQSQDASHKNTKDNGINFLADVSYFPIKGFEVTPVVLYKFNRWFSLGVGFSLGGGETNGYQIEKFDNPVYVGIDTYNKAVKEINQIGIRYRFFSRLLITFTDSKIVPFFSTDLGLTQFYVQGPYALNLFPQIGVSFHIKENNYVDLSTGPNFKFYTYRTQLTDEEGNDRGTRTSTITILNPTVTIGYRLLFDFKK